MSRLVTDVVIPDQQFGPTYDPFKLKRFLASVQQFAQRFNLLIEQGASGVKTVDTTRSTAGAADDPDLYVKLDASGIYLIEGYLNFTYAGGLILGMSTSDSGNTGNAEFLFARQTGAAAGALTSIAVGSTFTDTTNAAGSCSIRGSVVVEGPTTIAVHWGSNTNAQSATIKAGSLLTAELFA